jgi:hypothetical protein
MENPLDELRHGRSPSFRPYHPHERIYQNAPVAPPPRTTPPARPRPQTRVASSQTESWACASRSTRDTRRLWLFISAALAVLTVVAIVVIIRDDARPGAHRVTNPTTASRRVVDHPAVSSVVVNDAIRGMGIGTCWNARWSWSAADNSYMPVSIPVPVDCSSPDATQSLATISDDCRGTNAQMMMTQRAVFDGRAHCLSLVPSEGMCQPFVRNGNQGHVGGIPVVCDTPPSPRYPLLIQLASRLKDINDSCDTAAGYYYLWYDSVNTGFCYTILS